MRPSLVDLLSPEARTLSRQLGVRRVADRTLRPSELKAWLEARRWPSSSEVIHAEVVAGGYTHPMGGVFGLVGAMHDLAQGVVPPFHAPPFDQCRTDPRTGARLLPIWLGADPFLWLSEVGSVWFGSHADGREYFAPAFDSVVTCWEILTLLRGHVVSLTPPWRPGEWRLELGGYVAREVAEELGLREDEVARGARASAFVSPDMAAVELRSPGFFEGTVVVATSAEAVALAVAEALGRCEHAVLTGPSPLDADLLGALPPAREVREGGAHSYRWGELRRYRDEGFRRQNWK